jgi:hypothetical protein
LDGVIDVARRSDKLAQAMVVFVLAASSGSHASIITSGDHSFPAESRTETRRISDSRTEKWRELAQKTPECRDGQHAEHFDRENKGVETWQAVQSQLKYPRELVRRRSNLGAEKQP